jgi:hypothetical protein
MGVGGICILFEYPIALLEFGDFVDWAAVLRYVDLHRSLITNYFVSLQIKSSLTARLGHESVSVLR